MFSLNESLLHTRKLKSLLTQLQMPYFKVTAASHLAPKDLFTEGGQQGLRRIRLCPKFTTTRVYTASSKLAHTMRLSQTQY